MKRIPIVALCGFLGSGKTTLLRRWRRDEALRHAAVIVHDLSEFGLDVELLSGEEPTPVAGRVAGRVAALHGSHARERLHASVGTALDEISALDPTPPLVLCESTGAARPWPLIKALTQDKRFYLRHFIVTVDALNLHRDFVDGRVLTGEPFDSRDVALHHAAEVLAEQIAFASVIILTKIDTIPKSVVNAQVQTLQRLRPGAAIGLSAQAGLLLPQLDATAAPKLSVLTDRAEQFGLTQHASTADSVEALVLRDVRPFHPQRLHEACQSRLGTGLYRTKGFLWLASRPADVLLWQQSGSQIVLEHIGLWRAEMIRRGNEGLLPEEVEHLKVQLETEHPVFGDRHNELTLIGLEADRESFYSALQDALCTDEEVAAWQEGAIFPDPWPKSFRNVG
ncbi:MAG: GTP-binding protein [Thermoanaerobaculia bacterium]|nr:GTP-binding protein [Thermoanaerobaculia bacterium]